MFSIQKNQTHFPASSTHHGNSKTKPTTSPSQPSKQAGMTSTTAEIDEVKFVKAWMSKQTVEQVCRKMHITPQQAYSKANALRKKGVNLPKKQRPQVLVDKTSVEYLNKLIARLSK